MINRELLAQRLKVVKATTITLGDIYFRTATVRDIKTIQKEAGEIDQLVSFLAVLTIEADGTKMFDREMLLDMDMELLNEVATALNESGVIPKA